MDSAKKHLESSKNIGKLVRVNFSIIDGIQIAEVVIKPSPESWFFKYEENNKPQKFELKIGNKTHGQRYLDDFYIRSGGSKELLDTHKKFYDYAIKRFMG